MGKRPKTLDLSPGAVRGDAPPPDWLNAPGFDPEALKMRRGTIVGIGSSEPTASDPPGPGELPVLAAGAEAQGSVPAILQLGGLIGEGGMGIVREASQTPLGRGVAVKIARREGTLDTSRDLLREARVTGALEHPNIVPVHALGQDADGNALFVMKRIEGRVWAELMGDQVLPPETSGFSSRLEWHLHILMEVCNAAHFAHTRGLLHRDLKPDNVMVGGFGEIYVLDWGLAVRLRDDGPADVPHALEIQSVVGTPAYMAPEMANPQLGPMDERTDVFLLGAILYEIVAGKPPYDRPSAFESLLASAYSERITCPAGVPDELATICRRALAPNRDERYPSAEAMKAAIADYLGHASSRELSAEGSQLVATMADMVVGPTDSPERNVALQRVFSECRFAYRHALRIWPENPDAKAGLECALGVMARYELRRGDPDAEFLIAEMEAPDDDLLTRLEAVRRDRDAERGRLERLERLEHDADMDIAKRERSWLVFVVATLWLAQNLILDQLRHAGLFDAGFEFYGGTAAAFLVWVLGVAWRRSRVFMQNAANRRLSVTVIVLATVMAVHWPMAAWTGATFEAALAQVLLIGGLTFTVAGAALDPRLAWSGVIALAGWIAAEAAPELVYELAGIFGFASMAALRFVWRPRADGEGWL